MRSIRSGRRYRFGWLAAFVVGGYLAALVAFGVVALVSGDGEVLQLLVVHRGDPGPSTLSLLLVGMVQSWALWQILRGRGAGEIGEQGRAVRLLRVALYVNVVLFLLDSFKVYLPWRIQGLEELGQLALVVLFYRVLDGASRPLRLTALVAGTLDAAGSIGEEVFDALDLRSLEEGFEIVQLGEFTWLFWMLLTVVAQAGDGRWGRGTVWAGAASMVLPFFVAPLAFVFIDDYSTLLALLGVVNLFLPVWLARSAHDLAGPHTRRVRTEKERIRAPLGWWPLPVAAVVLPLLPVAVNLAHGLPFWIGPTGMVESLVHTYFWGLTPLWWFFDLLVGVGGLGVLVLVMVVRRTRRLLRATVSLLVFAAAVGAVIAVAIHSTPAGTANDGLGFGYSYIRMYPEGMFTPDPASGEVFFGISPLWHSAALTASALILTFLYGRRAAPRSPYRMAVACVAALCLLPVADQVRGPVTSRGDCEPPERWRSADGEPPVPPPTGERAFVCAVRTSDALPSARSTPDQALVAYGHRLCGVYTRDDPQELARVRETGGPDVRTLSALLVDICPRAAEVIRARNAAEEREILEGEAEEQRKCDQAPRHRPLIKPMSVSVHRKPLWTDYGVLDSYEPGDDGGDPFEDGLLELLNKNELVAAIPGHLMVGVHSDYRVCVTTETYRRRPPVETRGWHHVVEVGYRSPTGEIRLADPTGGSRLPNLAVRGRGDYRIRVHYAWLPWKGEKYGGQRLLIMAYPGRGDEVVVHRRRTRP
ncbi:hypothetical protein ACIBF6_02655 [Streptosporangium amethystogenes]|uniref:hypothetical protein n=1 Tax=Streptosporangium amethystogenes TaxID=2002 RepID=UPI003788D040